MATVDLDDIDRDELIKMYQESERDCRELESENDDLRGQIDRLEDELDDAGEEGNIAGLDADTLAEAIDMIVAGDMSGALHTIRRACSDPKVEAACDRAFSALKCLVPA